MSIIPPGQRLVSESGGSAQFSGTKNAALRGKGKQIWIVCTQTGNLWAKTGGFSSATKACCNIAANYVFLTMDFLLQNGGD
ncbi:hypothetical protein LJB86_01895 [Deltaproteobacteria bacterium OttesenSCG-928-M10]|nr:hypothetical protein [Deltaproteobacteria bacterium OttesenSCG-928-M10]